MLDANHPGNEEAWEQSEQDAKFPRVFASEWCHNDRPKNADQQGAEQAKFEEICHIHPINEIVEDHAYRHEYDSNEATDLDIAEDGPPVILNKGLVDFFGM